MNYKEVIMKHFIIDVRYKVPFEQLNGTVTEHRAFLQIGYDNGMLLCSGPKETKKGAIILAKTDDVEKLKVFFKNDPYIVKKLAEYEYIEFNPVKFQPFLQNWIEN
jgi:uncharacterized protein YciI